MAIITKLILYICMHAYGHKNVQHSSLNTFKANVNVINKLARENMRMYRQPFIYFAHFSNKIVKKTSKILTKLNTD